MSVVTNVILTFSLMDQVEGRPPGLALEHVNRWLAANGHSPMRVVDQHAGGEKSVEAVVAMGAFNHLRLGQFFVAVRAAPWEAPEDVRVFVQEQEDEHFSQRMPPDGPAEE